MQVYRFIALLTALTSGAPLAAQTATPWHVAGKLFGKPHKNKDGYKRSVDVSGIACATSDGLPRTCLIIDDNVQFAQVVTLDEGRLDAGPIVPLIQDSFADKPLELDGEGVAFADGTFYVIGSHGRPRDSKGKLDPVEDRAFIEARIKAASQIVPVTLATKGAPVAQQPLSALSGAIDAEPDLAAARARTLQDNGLTIEGVGVRGDRLFAGFRGPVLADHRAAVLSVSLNGLQTGGDLSPHLFRLELGAGRGIRDIASYRDNFLVLSGPVGDEPGGCSIALWDGSSDGGVHALFDLKDAGIAPDRKAEALLFLDETAHDLRVLVMFDGEEEGAPLALTIPKPR